MQNDKRKLKLKFLQQVSRAHQRPAYKSQVFINKETEAAAEPHRIGTRGRGETDEK